MAHMYEITEEWRERLRDIRKNSGKSLRDFSYILGGVASPSTLNRLENGKQRYVSDDVVLALSNFAGCDFTPVIYKCDKNLKQRILELEKENRILRDYIHIKGEKYEH